VYSELESSLEEAALEAFRRLSSAHSAESFYCAALYTSDGYTYVVDTANTSKGLEDLVEASIARGTRSDVPSAIEAYKWSPCDWPYHLANEELFERPNKLLRDIWSSLRSASEAESERGYVRIHEIFVSVLRKVRGAGLLPEDCLTSTWAS
jgi:hypothetical protein